MRIVDFDTGQYGEPCVLLLGYFDGVHIGHRKLIARAEEIARALCCETGIMTFYDSKRGGQIYLFEERVMLFEKAGLDFVYAAHFNDAFRATDGIAFLDRVCASLNVRAFVCGKDHVFGKDAACGERELHAFCRARGIALHCEPLVSCGGQKAAATQAKGLLDAGDMPALQELLGGPYFILGTVSTEGRHVGRRIGFPTANIHLSPKKYPLRTGVYAVNVDVDGKIYRGIANYGGRPTFADSRVVLEVYADGYAGDLYGKRIAVYFDSFIREIKKFSSAEELSAQLHKDLEIIR